MMPPGPQTFRRLVLTASLVSLAAAMPLWAAVPLSVAADFSGLIESQTESATRATPADQLLELVTRAARQLCRTPAMATWRSDWATHRVEPVAAIRPAPDPQLPPPRLSLAHLINLPPPQA